MGGGYYSDNAASVLYTSRTTKSVDDVFPANKLEKIDPSMDPKGVKYRESCDSADHPESNAIMILFDVTGSMGKIPGHLARDPEKLPSLMRLLIQKDYIAHPQICFGAIGDATSDAAPFQVGQFESSLVMDDWLTKIWLEGRGGGQNTESYELAWYFAARHTKIDCFSKRQKKGYLFTMGDEMAYPSVSKKIIEKFFGDQIQDSKLDSKALLEEASKMYNVFHICVSSHSYADGHFGFWEELLGERALKLPRADAVATLIASTIGACEGRDLDDIYSDLVATGTDKGSATTARDALVPFATSSTVARRGTASADLARPGNAPGKSKRL